MRSTRLASGVLLLLALLSPVIAQSDSSSIPDEQRRFLEVRRRQIELKSTRSELDRVRGLFEQRLVAKKDLDIAQTAVDTAQLDYQQSVLSLLNLQPRISVKEAMKSQTRDGRKFVRLTIVNLTPTFDDSQFQLLNNFEGADPIPTELRKRDVQDIFISLKAVGGSTATGEVESRGTTIALPYEVHVPELKYGQEKTMQFQLLRDVQSVMVAAAYKGQRQEMDIQLEQAETESVVSVSSTQISQEADLGGQVTYDLKLERSTVDVRGFQLRVLNLPRQISYSFIDRGTQARLSQINFPAGVTQQQLGLRLFFPEHADQSIPIDQPLVFWAAVMNDQQATAFTQERPYSVADLQSSRIGYLHLTAIPRGVGRIEVSANSLFSEIQTGEKVETTITVRNTGTRTLDNIRLTTEYPLSWKAEVIPDIISTLDINREASIKLRILPPDSVPVGDYEVRIKSESFAYNRRVPTEDKIYRVNVKAPANLWATAGLVGGLLAILVGIVVFGVKLTKR
ncbi:MAG: hypothetical protein EHM61_26640 [Acidobacteria bacterium]|nr:MAG: hypothetical protein EHM61_26640 [Acidobacteriota bacterium]